MIQIEADKFYKTRDGRKAYVAAVLENKLTDNWSDQPVIGFTSDYPDDLQHWNKDGGFYTTGDETEDDLVAEWKEPRTIEKVIYFVERGYGVLSVTKNQGDDVPYGTILAKRHVTLTEGEGLAV